MFRGRFDDHCTRSVRELRSFGSNADVEFCDDRRSMSEHAWLSELDSESRERKSNRSSRRFGGDFVLRNRRGSRSNDRSIVLSRERELRSRGPTASLR
ncbi:hypothetical protein C492_04615 [Natronococcus jeotgali DSM 18795]|uniref:Uncharacterized protein n=1 Tax=Natronococcus jeotgali DSM 18795 TaxID=1227498 RepID=L9XSN0_9EURY|nr:hypothetical protein C492_04615 [Natronococcus jeotgali DSM 18795]